MNINVGKPKVHIRMSCLLIYVKVRSVNLVPNLNKDPLRSIILPIYLSQ